MLTLEERVSVIKKSDNGKACRAIAYSGRTRGWKDADPDHHTGKGDNEKVGSR